MWVGLSHSDEGLNIYIYIKLTFTGEEKNFCLNAFELGQWCFSCLQIQNKHELFLSLEPASHWTRTRPLAILVLRPSNSVWSHTINVLLVSLGCHSKMLQTGWLKQEYISHTSGGKEVQDQSAVQFDSLVKTLFLACKWLPFHCVLSWWGERKRKLWCLFYKSTNSIMMTSSKPDYLPKAHFQISSYWGLKLQHMNLVGIADKIQSIAIGSQAFGF